MIKHSRVFWWSMAAALMFFSSSSVNAQLRIQSSTGKNREKSSTEPLEIVIEENIPAPGTPAASSAPASSGASPEEAMDAEIRRAEQRARNLEGTDALIGRLNVIGLKRLRKPTLAFNAAQAAMKGNEAFDFGRIRTLDDLEHRIRAFEQLQRSSADLKRALQSLPLLFAEEMRNSGGKEDLIPEAVRLATGAIGLESMLEQQEAVNQMSSSAIAQLRVLKRNWGKWKGTGPQVSFESSVSKSDVRAFGEYGEQLRASLARIAQLRQSTRTE